MDEFIQPANEIETVIRTYSDTLFKICLLILCKEQDAEDALQETFLRYMLKAPVFNETEHQKAWLIRVAANVCKDIYRYKTRHNHMNIDELSSYGSSEEDRSIVNTVAILPQKYKIVILLHYIEGYDVKSIADITGISVSAAKKRLQRGREKLKILYEEDL